MEGAGGFELPLFRAVEGKGRENGLCTGKMVPICMICPRGRKGGVPLPRNQRRAWKED